MMALDIKLEDEVIDYQGYDDDDNDDDYQGYDDDDVEPRRSNVNYYDMTRGEQYRGNLLNGQLLYSILYGGRYGYITNIKGQQSPGTIQRIFGGAVVTGGNAWITVKFDSGIISEIPGSIIRGVQWYISDGLADQEEIDLEHDKAIKEKQELEQRKKQEEEIARRRLPNDYPHL